MAVNPLSLWDELERNVVGKGPDFTTYFQKLKMSGNQKEALDAVKKSKGQKHLSQTLLRRLKKSPYYVAAVTNFVKEHLSGENRSSFAEIAQLLKERTGIPYEETLLRTYYYAQLDGAFFAAENDTSSEMTTPSIQARSHLAFDDHQFTNTAPRTSHDNIDRFRGDNVSNFQHAQQRTPTMYPRGAVVHAQGSNSYNNPPASLYAQQHTPTMYPQGAVVHTQGSNSYNNPSASLYAQQSTPATSLQQQQRHMQGFSEPSTLPYLSQHTQQLPANNGYTDFPNYGRHAQA
ncbi:hypothetical protein CC80DRAFT_592767 [Byssothecium circinans]|uniref:Uncharacterized protein n=1 Tax=Byssothecium circinans TaxID=147558 RepID=A0A6A5U3G4_9PLEO|nr:hypothetical protein CC80DRAFT_592767 [Byssothecium circinans]